MQDSFADELFWRNLAYPQKVDLAQRLKLAHDIRNDSFEQQLMRLLHKADPSNGEKMRRSYPELTATVSAWQNGRIKSDYSVT